MAEPKAPPIVYGFKSFAVTLAHFSELPLADAGSEKSIEAKDELSITLNLGMREDYSEAQVVMQVKVVPDPRVKPYDVSVVVEGIFTTSDPSSRDNFDRFIRQSAPAILFPYAREVVHRLTVDGRFGVVKLPLMNVSSIAMPENRVIPSNGLEQPSEQSPSSSPDAKG